MNDIKNYVFDIEKNETLKKTRGVSFEDAIQAIEDDRILAVLPHHNSKKYQTQHILVLEICNYAYLVPCIIKQNEIILKTIYPSRKASKIYLPGENYVKKI